MNELAGNFLKLALTRFSHMKMTEPSCLGHKSGLTTRSAYILSTYCNQRLSVVINGVRLNGDMLNWCLNGRW